MDDRKRLFTIILIMTTICLAVAGVTMSILYNPAFEEQRARLVETAQSQARLIEAVARFDAIHSKEDHPKGSEAATLSQIIDAHKNYKGFGKTGEFTLARREGDSIVFLLSHRHYDFDTPKPVRFDSELAEPMRLALSGLSGSMVGLDYRRKKVLAAYEPIAELDYGIVAKIDLAEIRAPFVKAGVIAGFLAVLFIFAGAVLFLWISNPMIRRLRENEEKYRSLIANIPDVVWRSDREGNTTFISPKVKEIYGYLQEEIYKEGKRLWLDRIHPDDFEHVKDAYDLLFKGSEKFDVEYRIKRKDGNWIWLHDKSIGTYERDGEIYADGLFSDITEIKQAEEALWKSEREKGAILSNMSERVVHQDLEMRVLWANKVAAESVDSKPEELIKRHCYEIWHQRSEPCADCPILKSIETGQLHEGEIVSPDGRVWLIKGNPVKDASGKVVSIVEVAEDITERKLLEEALELSQNRYALAQRVANIGVWEWNIRSGEIYWSEQIEPMFGFGHGEFGGTYEAFIECVHPEDHLYVNDSVKAAVEKDKDYDIEHRIVWPDGTIHWLSEIGDVIHDENGNPIRMIGVVLDITRRKQAEEALRESAHLNELFLDSLPHPAMLIRRDRIVLAANRIAREVGTEVGEYCWRSFGQSEYITDEHKRYINEHNGNVPPGGTKCVFCLTDEMGATNEPMNNPEVKAFGQLWDTWWVPVDGEVYLHYAINVTARKQSEEELRIAKEEAEVANQAKSDFLASMSHELRTPLNAVIGFSEVLRDRYFGELNEKQADYVNDILESGKHLLSLINDILDLSKVEAGKMELELSPVNIKGLLDSSLVMIKEKAHQHGISLDLKIPEEMSELEIQADERKLKQIMFNLLSNAAKFTPDRGTIEVAAKKKESELIISVSDTGIGIAPEDQDKVFDDFYQVKGSSTEKTPGTGLGLPLTKSLVEMHGGKIWVESGGEGKGSRFSFALPI